MEDALNLSKKQMQSFVHLFRDLDHDFAHLKSFSTYSPKIIENLDFSQDDYENYAAAYKNILEILKKKKRRIRMKQLS